MSRSTAPVWVCDYQDCRHVWLAASTGPPSHCAKCRRRGWNGKKETVAVRELKYESDL